MSAASVLVTRPHPDNEATAAALTARGLSAVVAPMLQFEAMPFAIDRDARYGGVVLTSANAVRALREAADFAAIAAWPAFAVGERTAQAAREAGFSRIVTADGDAAALREVIVTASRAKTLKKTATLFYPSAAETARDLPAELRDCGIAVDARVAYRMVAVAKLPAPAQQALAAGEIAAVLHYSARTARAFLDAARAGGVEIAALSATHCCLSDAIAAVLREAGAAQVLATPRPEEQALLDLLVRAPRAISR